MKTDKEQIKSFLLDLKWSWWIELNQYGNTVIKKLDDAYWKDTVYFCCGYDSKKKDRCSDDDFTKKKYIPIDIDVRLDHYNKTWKVLSEQELDDEIKKILDIIDNTTEFNTYSYAINSWNWLHLYYVWEEMVIDKKTYSDWITRVQTEFNDRIAELGYKCDAWVKNLARIMRLPWTYNLRKKVHKDKDKKDVVLRDMWRYECQFIKIQPQYSWIVNMLDLLAEERQKRDNEEKEIQKKVREQARKNRNTEQKWDIREEINSIPIWPIVEEIYWVRMLDSTKDCVVFREAKKNMWAYWYTPYNVFCNWWSSLIRTNKETFTTYELVYYEMFGKDAKKTMEYFKDKYWIDTKGKEIKIKEPVIIEKKEYEKKWFVYPSEVFDRFKCFMSGELVTIVAESNSWKTTFAMDIISKNAEKWRKWFYINLEFAIENVRMQKRLREHWKDKLALTDLNPLTEDERYDMEKYVEKNLNKFDYYNDPNWIELDDLLRILIDKREEWYDLVVIDTFSRIHWNLEKDSRISQNKCMEKMQELAQKTWLAIVMLHHTNRAGTREGTQKIMDLSNVFIMMEKWDWRTTYKLQKDKFVQNVEIDVVYNKWQYLLY